MLGGFGEAPSSSLQVVVKVAGKTHNSHKVVSYVRGHDKPRLMGVADRWYGKNHGTPKHLSNVGNPVDIPLYWLVNRDPYYGLL